jgi:hypothetical protein
MFGFRHTRHVARCTSWVPWIQCQAGVARCTLARWRYVGKGGPRTLARVDAGRMVRCGAGKTGRGVMLDWRMPAIMTWVVLALSACAHKQSKELFVPDLMAGPSAKGDPNEANPLMHLLGEPPAPKRSPNVPAQKSVAIVRLDILESDGMMNTAYALTAIQSSVTINSIVANRGNCELTPILTTRSGEYGYPYHLRYGDALRVLAHCAPIEIGVYTDQGYQRFTRR